METDQPNKFFSRLTTSIFVIVLPLLFVDIMWGNIAHFQQRSNYSPAKTISTTTAATKSVGDSDSLDFVLSRLVQGEDLKSFRATGFGCDTQEHSKHCITNRAAHIDTTTMTVTIPSEDPFMNEMTLHPYARQEDKTLIEKVTPVRIVRGKTMAPPPPCDYSHNIPAVVFSTSGFVGNTFHEMDETIIPLFITTFLFNTRVVLIMEDYKPSFAKKYRKILSGLSSREILNPAANRSVHCFPAAVVGLKFHGFLSVNSSDIPRGLTTSTFRQFLRRAYDLKYSHISQIKNTPTVMLVSRTTSRRIINQDEVVAMMEDLGFRVIVVKRAKVVANLNVFSSMINACSVFVGVHGAGLTNEVFLPDGAVLVQVDLIGLEWAAEAYFGRPTPGMGLRYLRYKIEPEESSLLRIFGSRSHKAFTDPGGAFPVDAGTEVYLNGQNININVDRFRQTMAMAMSFIRD
ncbi:alpha-1,3-arabinosyltransferase XAT3-like [Salvia miltiorrhiza]|uniref:alpha-1,3-arabinosyltransferase XAT3-like n=1 Tax=Salvia miltiorrhiza TaxID=226208 RepID=UPI0025AD25F8|nr:alpha-1,3-arabinosyltransferase XAT3-like [Salvia miltiorrhiza]